MVSRTALTRLLSPKTLAVFGGAEAEKVVRQCEGLDFRGEIWAVNPRRERIAARSCFDSVATLPGVPDAAFIAAPPDATIDIVRELASLGAGGAVCFASGFAEAGRDGAARQEELKCAAGDMAIIGPNCHGFVNYLDGAALWPDEHGGRRVTEGVALILQSGNVGINLSMQQRGLAFTHIISLGNKAVVGVSDCIELLLEDSRIKAIGLHIEGLDRVHEFSLAAIRALRQGIPIVAMKTGRSALGAEMTLSHTSSLAGPDQFYSALFARLGIARCETLSHLLETLKFVSTVGMLDGRRIGSMSCSGGEASIVADCACALDLDMPPLSRQAKAQLREALGDRVHLSNPLDYHSYAWGDYGRLRSCFEAMLRNRFDCTMLVLDYPLTAAANTENWEITERALIDAVAATGQRAVIASSLPETLPDGARDRLFDAGITPMQGLEECLVAMRAAAVIGRAQEGVEQTLPVQRPVAVSGSIRALTEWEGKAELSKCGLTVPEGRLCDPTETVDVAADLGFPVALKVVSNEIAHKTEAGAVALRLGDRAAVRDATLRMVSNGSIFLVEKMIEPAIAEMIVGISRDPTFGLMLLIGAGGVMVELLDDTVVLPLPVQRHEIRAAVGSLRISRLLNGYRGAHGASYESVIDAVTAVSDYALANEAQLVELDINPLVVTPDQVVAVDAYIRRVASGAPS